MARRLRIQFPGAIYHVTARGVERRRIFVDDVDRTRFLTQLGATTRACHVRLYLYCLMANHVHLVLETELPNLSQFMHRLETAYAVDFDFRDQIQRPHYDRLIHAHCAENVAFRRQRAEKSTAQILTVVANAWGVEVVALRRRRYRCPARAVAARMLWAHAGLNQRQIGRLLQMGTGASVSAHLKRLERAMAADPKLQARCAVIDSRLNVDC